jgi:hypothetical protein
VKNDITSTAGRGVFVRTVSYRELKIEALGSLLVLRAKHLPYTRDPGR